MPERSLSDYESDIFATSDLPFCNMFVLENASKAR